MNGLEAIKFMEQGNRVVSEDGYLYVMFNGSIFEGKVGKDNMGEVNFFCLTKEYEEYIEPKQPTGWERVVSGNCYYYLERLTVNSYTDHNDDLDSLLHTKANYFSTEEKAEEINFKQTLFRKLQRFSDENGGSEIDWSDGEQEKYSIVQIGYNSKVIIDITRSSRVFGQVYFISEEVAVKALELFKEDLIKYFTHSWSKGE